MTDFKQVLANAQHNTKAVTKEIPDVIKQRNALHHIAFKDGALTEKTKELIALAFGIADKCDACIAHHVKKLITLGVTRAEIAELTSVAILMNGGPGMVYAAKALEAFDQLSEEYV
ncbi:carboxymuconolactone decarboxylase family protein [Aerococcaceae bacterium zg-ZJ1578]|uniref:carboxymuconolactone decarboxylase family protein n=1 Tax=Aerococcaceae bacterium zg-252 TaxID=2796928 RepID=UPI001A21B548|nr:carboxymuconolactone decarboxylase family protein [Aerococcaceae bacterium zg-1578]